MSVSTEARRPTFMIARYSLSGMPSWAQWALTATFPLLQL
jgi:hypothetical protein